MTLLAKVHTWTHHLVLFICLCFSQTALGNILTDPNLTCDRADISDASTFVNDVSRPLLTSSFVYPENEGLSKRARINRVKDRIAVYHGNRVHSMPLTDEELAETIVWAADCMGHDFQVFTGMLEVESYICGDRTGPNGDRGCSMFTNDPIKELKNQMKLPGKLDNHSDVRVRDAMLGLIRSCYDKYQRTRVSRKQPYTADQYIGLLSGSRSNVKETFLNGNHIHADLLSGALYLKFKTALAGGYWPNQTPGIKGRYRSRGGINLYNSSNRAVAHSNKVKGLSEDVRFICVEHFYARDVEVAMCGMEPDPQACVREVLDPSIEI